MLHLIPRPLARIALRAAHTVRHRWRLIRKSKLRGVSVIARDADGRVLLVRHTYASRAWALPGGGLSKSEDPLVGALRELQEELNLQLQNPSLLGWFSEQISGSPHQAYVVTGLAAGQPQPDGREIADYAWFAADDLPGDATRLTRTRLALLPEFQKSAS